VVSDSNSLSRLASEMFVPPNLRHSVNKSGEISTRSALSAYGCRPLKALMLVGWLRHELHPVG